MIDDAELLRRYAEEKSEAAFAELVRRHVDLVHSAALRRLGGDSHVAADVTQRVFAELARRANSIARHHVLLSWLYSTTRNMAVDHVRAERRRRDRERSAQIMNESDDAPSSSTDWTQLHPILDEAMDALGEKDRTAVLLRFFARQSFNEIGRALDLSEDAARMRVDRALVKLRAQFSGRGVQSTAAGLAVALTNQAVSSAPVGLAASVTASSAVYTTPALTFAAPLVQFMSTSKMGMSVAVTVAALCVGTAMLELKSARGSESARVNALEDQREAEARLVDVETRAREEESRAVALEQSFAAARNASVASPRVRSSQVKLGPDFVARHPAVHHAVAERLRAHAAGWYAPLFKVLHLTPVDIERCVDLIVQKTPVRFRVPDVGELSLEPELSDADFESKLSSLIGEDGLAQYRTASRTREYWRIATTVAASSYHTSTPLTPANAERLMRILAENSPRGEGAAGSNFDWDAVLLKSGMFLSAEQLTPLKNMQASQTFAAEMREWLHLHPPHVNRSAAAK